MRDIMAQMLTLLPPSRKPRHIGLGLGVVVILLPFFMLACTKQPGAKAGGGGLKITPSETTTTAAIPTVSSLPQPEQTLLGFVSGNCPHSILSMMERLTGYGKMEGSGLYPGTLTMKPGPYRSYRIAWTLDVKPGSILSYNVNGMNDLAFAEDLRLQRLLGKRASPPPPKDMVHAGQTVFRFWMSHDGSRMTLPVMPPSSKNSYIIDDNRFAYAFTGVCPGVVK